MALELLSGGYTKTSEGDILPPLHVIDENKEPYTAYTIHGTPIEGLLLFERMLYPDDRGFYQELSRTLEISRALKRAEPLHLEQTSLSYNEPNGVLRGLHAEPMDKLVTPITGRIFIAIADIRPDSPTFGQNVTFLIDQRNHRKPRKTIVVSNGLANSFLTVGDEEVHYLYQITAGYKSSEGKRAVAWNDPDLNIPWPVNPTIISHADQKNPTLRELFPAKFI